MNDLLGPIIENVVAGLLGSAIVFAGGFLVGRYRERRRAEIGRASCRERVSECV